MVLMGCKQEPQLNLLKHATVHYPSASAIEYHNNRLFVFGDDAAWFMVMDTAFRFMDSVRLFSDTTYRIPKHTKPDLEAVAFEDRTRQLVVISSGSLNNRNYVAHIQAADYRRFLLDTFYYAPLRERLNRIEELNLEGLTKAGNKWIAANRANQTHRKNLLLISDSLPWKNGTLTYQELQLNTPGIAGVSGLFYWRERDILFLTCSEEETATAVSDGAIGNSYLGWVENYSAQIKKEQIQPSVLINLSERFNAVKGHKIESLTLQQLNQKTAILYLAADDDNGESSFFQLRLSL
jgi:hypothetical protein